MNNYENPRFNTHNIDLRRHYCPRSQRYAGCDVLLAYLETGWTIFDDIFYEEYWHGGARCVTIYTFVLGRHNQTITMRVLSNPVVERFLSQNQHRVLPYSAARERVRRRIEDRLH